MISTALARELRDAGLVWTPASGDAFQIAPDNENSADFEGDVFTVSDMTIEAHVYATGTVLGFNGTTEWALDSVALDDALWLPREDQLRDLLRGAFHSMRRDTSQSDTSQSRVSYAVMARIDQEDAEFLADDPAEAYGLAVLALIRSVRAE
ncbi:MAG: pilus assembly protein CpaE [Actinomycetota bacterium]|nr:pilus assembly protein CpaE [Actinomycetota bacterium]